MGRTDSHMVVKVDCAYVYGAPMPSDTPTQTPTMEAVRPARVLHPLPVGGLTAARAQTITPTDAPTDAPTFTPTLVQPNPINSGSVTVSDAEQASRSFPSC
jgi:hypothetical protein